MSATSTSSDKGSYFRSLHQGEGAFIMPNPWDVGTARILASQGFKALATTSAGMAFALGKPEGQTSRDDVLAHCRMMVEATDLPVSADLEKGFGDSPEAVAETIHAAAATGLAGCSIEDHTNRPDDPIFAIDLAVERIQAAVEACRSLDHDFVLTARAENFLWERPDLDDTIARLQAFEKAGADVLYAPGLRDLETIRSVCAALEKPVNVIMGMPGVTFGKDELAEAGVKRISVGSALARAVLGTFLRAGEEMVNDGSFSFAGDAAGFDELQTIFSGFIQQS
ncbi:MAG: isocitrate lyase/phosphoenolpyruvate mutase family protein [Pseudomonadota bacterium]